MIHVYATGELRNTSCNGSRRAASYPQHALFNVTNAWEDALVAVLFNSLYYWYQTIRR